MDDISFMDLVKAIQAGRLYIERIVHRNSIADKKTFQSIHQRLLETVTFERSAGPGRPIIVRMAEVEEHVLDMIQKDSDTSAQKIANFLIISKTLRHYLLYQHHVQRVLALLPTDFASRIAFCHR